MGLTTGLWVLAMVAAVGLVVGLALDRKLLWKSMLAVLVLAACGAGLNPHRDEAGNWRVGLKPGLDLAGGTSLIYKVQVGEDQDPNEIVPQVITTLKQRVDPEGVRNLQWRQEAGNRIEIQMPRPREEVFERRNELQGFEAALRTQNLTPLELRELEAAADEPDRYQRMVDQLLTERNVAARGPLFEDFRASVLKLNAAVAEREAARGDPARYRELAGPVADARIEVREARRALLATNLSVADLRRAMSRPDKAQEEGELSPRQRSLEKLKAAHPHRVEDIEGYVELHNRYQAVRGPLDDPEDLKRLLRGAGVLSFRITADPERDNIGDLEALRKQLEEQGPDSFRDDRFVWVKIDDPAMFADTVEERDRLQADPAAYFEGGRYIGAGYGGDAYLLCWNTLENSLTRRPAQGEWGVTDVSTARDENAFPAVAFELNPTGARWMRKLTGPNQGRNMAMILDGEILSAPRINSALSSTVLITGGRAGFSQREQAYLINTLSAGSLQAELSPEPIAERTIGPRLGRDNLRQGMTAARDALIAVAAFMILYYFFSGGVTAIALLSNIIIILGIMSAYQAAFTLPGIAGVVLTIGMCVDANVLIFERIREELNRGTDTATALRLGYQRAFSSIIDSNLTNLIVCFILYQTATTEVRGFAITLGIGIVATLFTSLFMTRVIFQLWFRFIGGRAVRNQLPVVVPAIDKLLTPSVRWIAKKPAFFILSGILVAASVAGVVNRGEEMLDIEFRAGTAVTFELGAGETMTLAEARQRRDRLAELYEADPGQLDGEAKETAEQLRTWVEDRRKVLIEERLDEAEGEGREVDAERVAAVVREQTDLRRLSDATVVSVGAPVEAEGQGAEEGTRFTAFSLSTTLEDAKTVSEAIRIAFTDVLDQQPALTFTERGIENILQAAPGASPVQAITTADLSELLNRPVNVAGEPFVGGAAFTVSDIQPAVNLERVASRLQAMRLQPDFRDLGFREPRVVGLDTVSGEVNRFTRIAVLVKDPRINYFQDREAWDRMVDREWELIHTALTQTSSLARVSNFTPTVAQTLKDRAIVAVLLSLAAIIAYIWFRFGSLNYGLAAIAALVHDVCLALGALVVSHILFGTPIGEALLIGQFKINTGLIAALLTIIGYSLNDTIVLFDRIRENRGKLAVASPEVIDRSINQTISRTLLTSLTTLLAVGMLYVFGGEGIRGFAFALLVGVIFGTYSSIAIAAPLLTLGRGSGGGEPMPEPEPERQGTEPAPVGAA